MSYSYTGEFAPGKPPPAEFDSATANSAEQQEGTGYVYNDDIILAVNVAIVTNRPLLVLGDPGTGKSSLAPDIARVMKWRYYREVITSHTEARDLLWSFDSLRRLSDAQASGLSRRPRDGINAEEEEAAPVSLARYVEPGVLWWAINRGTAKWRGMPPDTPGIAPATDPNAEVDHPKAVVLLDEIDKADPDVPNDLLVAVGSYEFLVSEISEKVKAAEGQPYPLLVITSNNERKLPQAFLRRCVMLELKAPDPPRLVEIAKTKYGNKPKDVELFQKLAEQVVEAAKAVVQQGAHQPPSTAEYLDAVKACLFLGVEPSDSNTTWQAVKRATIWKWRVPELETGNGRIAMEPTGV